MAIQINDNIYVRAGKPIDFKFGPFSSIQEANSTIPIEERYNGLTFGVYDEPNNIEESDISLYYYYGNLTDDYVKLFESFIHPIYTPYNLTLSGATVLESIVTDSIGSVSLLTLRNLTVSDIGAQLVNNNLSAISILNGTGLLRKISVDTWDFDTNTYLTQNQNIALSGDVIGSGITGISTTISNKAVTYAKIQDVTANRILGRLNTNGSIEELTDSEVLNFINAVPTSRILSISGTTNQIIVSSPNSQNLSSDRNWILSLPQDIHTLATPTFADLTINGNIGLRATATGTSATQIPIFTANPESITRTLVTRTPSQLLNDMGGLPLSGGTMTGFITLHSDPSQPFHAATKQYVDAVSEGLHIHPSVKAATTASLASLSGATVIYDNGVDGIGSTLSLSIPLLSIDGYILNNGDRILIKNESNKAHNGLYVRTSSTLFTRATDQDNAAETQSGDFVFVSNGNTNGKTGWVQIFVVNQIGVDPLDWEQFSGQGTYIGSNSIVLNVNSFERAALTGDVTAPQNNNTLTISNNAVTNAKFRQSDGLSIIGRASDTTGNIADIIASTDNQVLRRSGTSIGFGAINLASSNAVSGVLSIANGGTNNSSVLNNNRIMISSTGAIVEASAITPNRAIISDSNGIPTHSIITDTEISYLSGVTSNVQTQINTKIAGTIASGQVAFGSGTNTVAGSNNLFWDNANGRLGIGTNSPAIPLQIGVTPTASLLNVGHRFMSTTENSGNAFNLTSANEVLINRPVFQGVKSRGTLSSPTAVLAGDLITTFLSGAYDGSAIQFSAGLFFDAESNASTGNAPQQINLVTGTSGTNRTTKLQVRSNGNVIIQNGGTFTDAGFRLDVNGTARVQGATTIDSTLSLRASATASAATQIPVFTADPTSTTRTLTTRTPAQLLSDAGGISGTISLGQVAFGSGTNTITGDNGLL